MSDRDEYPVDYGDDSPEDVARAFEQVAAAIKGQHKDISARFQKLNDNLTAATGTLGDLVKSEYAGELARLGERVKGLTRQVRPGSRKPSTSSRRKVKGLYVMLPVPEGPGCETRRRDPGSRGAGPEDGRDRRAARGSGQSSRQNLRMVGRDRLPVMPATGVLRPLGPARPGGNRGGADDHG